MIALLFAVFLSTAVSADSMKVCQTGGAEWSNHSVTEECMHIQADDSRLLVKSSAGLVLLSDPVTTVTYQPRSSVIFYDTSSMYYLQRFKKFFQALAKGSYPGSCQKMGQGITRCALTLFGDAKLYVRLDEKFPYMFLTEENVQYQIPEKVWVFSKDKAHDWTITWPDDVEIIDMRKNGESHARQKIFEK